MFDILKRRQNFENLTSLVEIDRLTPQHTPDMWKLEEVGYTWVFVCDECQAGHRKHDLVEGGASGMEPFFAGYTAEKMGFLIKRLEKMSFPIPFKDLSDNELPVWMGKERRIRGEMYGMTAEMIKKLDDYKQNGVQFERMRVNINVPYYKKKRIRSQTYNGTWSVDYQRSKDYIVTIPAMMYIARPEYWMDQLKDKNGCFNFDPVKTWSVDRIWIKEYFEYRRFV